MPLPSPDDAPSVDLSGRVVMVTGAAGGIGRAVTLACAARGATLVLHGRVVRKLEALYDEIVAAGHPQPTILPLDLATASADDFGHVASAIRAQLGRLDALVHAAVFLGSLGPVEHQSFDVWQKVLRINLAAAMAMTRSAMPLLAKAPDASVVFTLDARGEDPRAYWGAYAVAKEGIRALTKVAMLEWGADNIRVNTICPWARTDHWDGLADRQRAARLAHNPLRRIGDPEADVGAVVVFLAGDAGSYVTGQTIHVDGGNMGFR